MFEIKAGTAVKCIKEHQEWFVNNFRSHTTKADQLFGKEEVAVDPVGKLGAHRGMPCTIGGQYAANGWYGFRRDGWVMLVPVPDVEFLN